MELRKKIRENIGYGLYSVYKKSRKNIGHISYAIYNTVLVSGIDIPMMKSVTDWNFVNSSGLIYVYNAIFTGIRLLLPILLYLKIDQN